jgi:NADPH:quinone reductase-like Zn-dependent oxidoreductase
MKAYALRSYGSPDRLDLEDEDMPVPAAGQVLVRVRATSVNPYDWHLVRGEPYVARLMMGTLGGLRAPKIRIPGCDMAGEVAAVGRGVTGFRPGDGVFGLLEQGGFAQYVSVPERLLAPKPANLSYEQAAAVPMAGVTAYLAVRDAGRVEPGQRVLVNGASGGVGTFAVQIARALGATVDAVCGARNADLVRSLGATEVIDYASADFTRCGRRYDVLVDIAGSRPLPACRRVLAPKATFVVVGGPAGRWIQPAGHAFSTLALGPLVSQRVVLADAVGCTSKKEILTELAALIEKGEITPVIGRRYPFSELPGAVAYQEQGHAAGKVVVTIADAEETAGPATVTAGRAGAP